MDVKAKKIAVLCNYELLPTRVGGMDYFFWMFDEKCKENNIEVDWFFPNISSHGNYSKLTIIDTNYQNVEVIFARYCETNDENYSFIIAHFVELCSPVFKKINELSKAKIIAVDHNPRPLNGYPLKKKIVKRIKGLLYSKYIDTFVSVSNYSENQLVKEFGAQINKKILVIFNGLDIRKFKKKVSFNSNSNFVIACHLRKDKGIQDVILAVNEIKSDIKIPFTITIYGEGHYKEELKKMIATFSLQNYFIFKGSIANLHEVYCNYDYLIHPSHGETFCYSVVESLLSNLPVITNNQGNVLGLVHHNRNGFLYQDNQIQELKNILKCVLNNEIKIENGLKNEQKVINLSLDKMVASYIHLLS